MRLIVVEDQMLLREGLARLLVDLGHHVVATLPDLAGLEQHIQSDNPDLVVMDIRLPPTHTDEGITAARAIKRDRPQLGVLLLSQHIETATTGDLLGQPGFGYLLKDRVLDIRDFAQACVRVADGGSALDPKVVAALIAGSRSSPLDHLSDREQDVLGFMAQGLSNTAIAQQLSLSPRTVEAHIGHLLTKLGIPDTQETNRRVLAVLAWLRDER